MRGGIGGRAEAIHQHENRHLAARLRPQSQDLPGDQIEESIVATHRQQRFCLLQPHTRAETAIELDEHRLLQQFRCSICLWSRE
jgi:hypothetical protein